VAKKGGVVARRYGLSLLLGVVVAASGCGLVQKKSNDKGNDRANEFDPAQAKIQVDAAVVSDVGGVLGATIAASSSNTQVAHASASSRIATAKALFAPGSFDTDFQVTIEEGQSLATSANLQQLIGDPHLLQAAGPTVMLTWTYDEDSLVPYTFEIPAPPTTALDDQVATGSVAVLYILNIPNSDDHVLGILPPSAVTAQDALVSFRHKSYGAFQAIRLGGSAAVAKQVATTNVGGKIDPTKKPGAFTIIGPTDTLTNATPRIAWEIADLADSYEVRLDGTDPACGKPYKTYDLKLVTSQVGEAGVDGANYVCVFAKNAAGETPATNNGFKFMADKTPPPAPDKPTADAATTTAVTFHWNAVVDTGGAGMADYNLQIGTTPGGSDIFNGPVVELTKGVPAFDGQTYYARVQAVDAVGNASSWSVNSDPVTVHAIH